MAAAAPATAGRAGPGGGAAERSGDGHGNAFSDAEGTATRPGTGIGEAFCEGDWDDYDQI